MKLRHLNHCVIYCATMAAVAGCATPDAVGPQALKVEAVFNVTHSNQSSHAYYTLGRYHDGSKAWTLAVDAYRKAIAIDAYNIEAYNAMGVALAQSGRRTEAESALRKAAALAPELAHVRSNLGYVLILAGEPEQAVLELEAAVLLDRNNAKAMANLRNALAQQDAMREASATNVSAVAKADDTVTSVARLPTKAISNSPISDSVGLVSAGTPMLTRTASNDPARALIKTEAPTVAAIGKPFAALDPLTLPARVSLRVIDQPTIAWGQPTAKAATSDPVSNPIVATPSTSPSVGLALTPTGRLGTAQVLSKLEVSNGNGTAGMAASVGHWLAAQGLPATSLTDHRPYTQVQTLVQFRQGHEEAAARVVLALPAGGPAVLMLTQDLRADVRVVLGRDWVATNVSLKRDACLPVVAWIAGRATATGSAKPFAAVNATQSAIAW